MRIPSLAAIVVVFSAFSSATAIADAGACEPVPPEIEVCAEFRARSVTSADVERLAVRLRSEDFDARRRGATVLARGRAGKLASFLHAELLVCPADGGTRIQANHVRIPGRLRHDVTEVVFVPCP